MDDLHWMQHAIGLARRAAEAGEVPIGAVVVRRGVVLGEGWNQPVSSTDPTAHAEVMALRAAARHVGNYRLPDATLYVTVEPCTMCAGALVHARIARLVFGTREPRAGAVRSIGRVLEGPTLNHRVEIDEGVCAAECAASIRQF